MRKNKDRGERMMMKGRPLSGRTFIGDLSDETAFELKDTQSWYSLKGVSEDIYVHNKKKMYDIDHSKEWRIKIILKFYIFVYKTQCGELISRFTLASAKC